MPAKRKKCEYCGKSYWATRSDSKWCSQICRAANRMETAKILIPSIPQSGVPGISFNRVKQRWDVRLLAQGDKKYAKYIGSCKELSKAIEWQREVKGGK